MPQKQKLNIEEKVKIIQDYLKGSISKIEATRTGRVSQDTIDRWVHRWVHNY